MKKRYIAFSLIAVLLSTSALADGRITTASGVWQDCGPAKVEAVRVEKGVVFALLKNTTDHWKAWKRISSNESLPSNVGNNLSEGALLAEYSSSTDLNKLKKDDDSRIKTELQHYQYQSLLENALLNDKTVIVRFPNTESCKSDNWASNAEMVQLNK